MIHGRIRNREKAAFLAGIGAVLAALAFVSVHAAGAGSPVIEAHGGDIDANGNDIRNVGTIPGFFDTACSGSQVVAQVYENGSYRCSDVSNTLSEVLASDNSAGSNNLDMNGNNVTGVDWLNPDGQYLNLDTNLSLSPDGDSASSGDVHNAGVIYAQAISGADAPSYNFQVSSENDLRFVADRDASNGGAWVWILDEDDGSLNADGDLNMSDNSIIGTHDGTTISLDLSHGDLIDTGGNTFSSGPTARLSNAHLDLRNNLLAGAEAVYPDASGSLTTDHMLDFDFGGDIRLAGPGSIGFLADSDGSDYLWEIQEGDGLLTGDGNLSVGNGDVGRITIDSSQTSPYIETITEGSMDLNTPSGNIKMILPTGSCTFDVDANLNCDGSKNWVHDLNETHEAVYSSQESPQVRAVVEDTVTVADGETVVELPDHFSGTVGSDEEMTVQVTPHSLATVAAVQRNTTHVTIAVDRDVAVDYRVTGIRDGYEDKQVVQPQADK